MENLHKQEQILLKKLVEAEKEHDRATVAAIKRTIGRINDEMKEIEEK